MLKRALLCVICLAILGCTGQMSGTILSFEARRPGDGKIKIKTGNDINILNLITNVRDFEDELLSFQNAKKQITITYTYYPEYGDPEKRITKITEPPNPE